MPTKTWEPPPRQSDTETRSAAGRSDESRNIETPPTGRGRNPDAAPDLDRTGPDHEDINTHGSER
jgi:hypothetical protein